VLYQFIDDEISASSWRNSKFDFVIEARRCYIRSSWSYAYRYLRIIEKHWIAFEYKNHTPPIFPGHGDIPTLTAAIVVEVIHTSSYHLPDASQRIEENTSAF